jgi:AcrR family transcriptional regulator
VDGVTLTVTPAPISPSAAPQRVLGTRVRAGNAMSRTRAVLLDAALRLLAERGPRRTSMADLAGAAGVAKGTLYNHFRTKEDVWSAVLEAEIRRLAEHCARLRLADAFAYAADRLATHPAVRRLAADEPALLTALLTAPATAPARRLAGDCVRDLLAGAGRDADAADIVLRWLESHLAQPGAVGTTPELLAAVLPPATIELD